MRLIRIEGPHARLGDGENLYRLRSRRADLTAFKPLLNSGLKPGELRRYLHPPVVSRGESVGELILQERRGRAPVIVDVTQGDPEKVLQFLKAQAAKVALLRISKKEVSDEEVQRFDSGEISRPGQGEGSGSGPSVNSVLGGSQGLADQSSADDSQSENQRHLEGKRRAIPRSRKG